MKAKHFDISTDSGMGALHAYTAEQRLQGKRVIVQEVSQKRSLDQNAMAFALYQQITAQAEDMSISDVRCRCKLDYGVPIRCANDADFAELWGAIESATTYEQRLFLMRDQEVTRKFKKPEFTQYIEEIIRDYSRQGYALAHPSEEPMRAAG